MRNEYTFSEIIKTVYALIVTKLFYRGARLIRRPVYMRGKSSLVCSPGLTTGHNCRFDLKGGKNKTLIIGESCEMGDNVHIVAQEKVTIGDHVLMASKVFISDTSHGDYSSTASSSPNTSPNSRPLHTKPVQIGNNVWIGENVCILLGVEIGDGCIIGANSVVNKSVGSNCIIAGSPARVVKRYDETTQGWMRA